MKKSKIIEISKSINSGITPSRKNSRFWISGTVPWLKTEQLGEHHIWDTNEKVTEAALNETGLKLYPPNTLSIALYGEGKTRGNISVLKASMTTNQACCNIVLDDELADYEYLFYYLKGQYLNLRALSSGVRKNLSSTDIKNFEVQLPEDIKDQQKIANVLSTIDEKIELNNRINAELEAMSKLIYDYWFVQFDFPISAEQAASIGRPDLEGKPYKTSGAPMYYNPTLKRDIPVGWNGNRMDEVANVRAGGDKPSVFSPDRTEKCSVPIYANGTEKGGLYGYTDVPVIDRPSVTISARGSIGYTVLRNNPFTPIIRLIVVTPNKGIPHTYLFEYIRARVWGKSGSVQQQLTVPSVESMVVLKPEYLILEKYSNILTPLIEKIENNLKQNQQLTELRDWLLPMLMNGQVTVE